MDIDAKVAEIDARSKSNVHRLNTLEEKLDDLQQLTSAVAVLAEKVGNTSASVEEIKSNVKRLMDAPARRYDAIVEKIIIMVVAAVVTYCLTKFGL